ncbi:RND multidrug efflux transporter, Acriflavin resistance protein [Klebsiella pneumoniae]|uniref:RND multidrug efflux transporter, Acriflavin resistance protein n=1 Tax=Klebsiella pneumoniae TaxID=573 RepID=A0A377ZBT4_KLEPN|nr:RND multidrug efflux transporter, Acriflavin resistance protein [Klebsiella pneumoniae]
MQNEMQWRERAEQISELYVRSRDGERVRLSNLVTITPTVGAPFIQQYNQFPSVSVSGSAAEGVSSRTAMAAMEQILQAHLPPGYDYAWSGISWQEQQTGNQAVWIVLAAVAMAWLFLVAQYESWTLPASVMLSVLFAIAERCSGCGPRLCQRCVCSDRAGAADRPGGEECDSDR